MTPIQQLMLGVGAKKKTYLDDVFSTYVYAGTGSATSINNGLNLSGEGGMVWMKKRTATSNHQLVDSVRGATKYLRADTNDAEQTNTNGLTAFNNNGFTLNSSSQYNGSGSNYASWTFRKAPGFFDIVTYTGSGSTQQIAHNLQSIPGCYMIKNTSNGGSWMVYHRQLNNGVDAAHYRLMLDGSALEQDDNVFGDTAPTATHFTAGSSHQETNQSGHSYVCYLFAGGESTAAGSNCIGFDASGDRITCGSSSNTTADFNFGTGDLTIECWIKCSSSQPDYPRIVGFGPSWGANQAYLSWDYDAQPNRISFRSYNYSGTASDALLQSPIKDFSGDGQWHHIAVSRSGNTWRLFVDGVLDDEKTWTGSLTNANMYGSVGNVVESNSSSYFNGFISNVRIVKGTAVYTSGFRPPTEPLTNITNTKLLCCNAGSATSATVTPITLTEASVGENNPDSPFDDPAGFVFGENGDQNVIKCGSVTLPSGKSSVAVHLGFEPQWLMFKRSDGTDDWDIYDTMRGWKWNKPGDGSSSAGSIAETLVPNSTDAEANRWQATSVTSTGFHLDGVGSGTKDFIYIAIRRPDGYVGKPASAGTDVFAMDTGAGGTTIPNYDSGFPVDIAIDKIVDSSYQWYLSGRLTGTNYLRPDHTSTQQGHASYTWDSNVGWGDGSWQDSTYQSWMFKRHAGFDVVNYIGNADTAGNETWQNIPHNLGRTPEMIWAKRRDSGNGTANWFVYHKNLNAGVNAHHQVIYLNDSGGEGGGSSVWNETLPTASSFTVGGAYAVNGEDDLLIALLFASVNGISKVGSYSGSGSSGNAQNIGFQPRFLITKRIDSTGDWNLFDTVGGISNSGADGYLQLNTTQARGSQDYISISSTGFSFSGGGNDTNGSGASYIYYAHA